MQVGPCGASSGSTIGRPMMALACVFVTSEHGRFALGASVFCLCAPRWPSARPFVVDCVPLCVFEERLAAAGEEAPGAPERRFPEDDATAPSPGGCSFGGVRLADGFGRPTSGSDALPGGPEESPPQ